MGVLALVFAGALSCSLVFAQTAKDFIYVGGKLVAVEVTSSGGSAPYLEVLPSSATLSAGQQPLNLTATLFNDGGNSGDKTSTATWSVVSGPGMVSAGVYTPPSSLSSSATAIVRATSGGYSDEATLTVNPSGSGGLDLKFNLFGGPSSPAKDAVATYTIGVQNTGPDTSGAFAVKFFKRVGETDTEIPNSALSFGSLVQGSISQQRTLTFGTVETFTLVAKIDYAGAELNTANNEITKAVDVQAAGGPAVEITDVVIMPGSIPESGQDVEVEVTWKSVGTANLTGYDVDLHASQTQGATLNLGNRVGTFSGASFPLAPGQSKSHTFDLGNPSWAAGTWYITAHIVMPPSGDEVWEESAVVSNSQFPDFYPGMFGIAPTIVQPGQRVTPSVRVYNGGVASGSAVFNFYLSDDEYFSSDDVQITEGGPFPIANGGYYDMSFPVLPAIPTSMAPGYYYLIGRTSPVATFDANPENDTLISQNGQIAIFTNVSVALNPQTVTLGPGQAQTFGAVVTGTPDPSVTWSIDTAGGAALNGTIDSNGFYLAPSTINVQREVTIRATTTLPPAYPATSTTIVTLVPNLTGTPPVVSLAATGQPFEPPADVTFTATASDADGTITKVEFYADNVLLNTDTTSPYEFLWSDVPQSQYSLVARAHDNEGFYTNSTPVIVRVDNPAYVEQGGLVVMEVEKGIRVAGHGDAWTPATAVAGYSGTEYLAALPDNGTSLNAGYVGEAPEIQLPVSFSTTGTYYVWIRGSAPATSGNSVHVGIDGAAVSSSDRIELPDGSSWTWTDDTMDSVRAHLTVSSAGQHTINIWMREDGFRIDRILLTTNSSYTPTGVGPTESPGGNLAPSLTNPGPQTDVIGVAATLTLSATDLESDPITYGATGLPPGLSLNTTSGAITGTPVSIGVYSVTATATAAGDTDTEVFQWTIAANQPPALTNPGTRTSAVDVATSLALEAVDPELDPITYGASGLPPGLSISSTTGVISGTPTTLGAYNVTGTASANGGMVSQEFTWNIAETAYGYRRTITIPASHVPHTNTLTNFPVLVSGTWADLKTVAHGGDVENANGYDIRFETTGGTKLDHEIEKWSASTGALVAWVRLPTLDGSVDTTFYMYYGNSGVTTPEANPSGVWSSTYSGVWHFNQSPTGTAPQVQDSTTYANHGTAHGSMTSGDLVTGKVGDAIDFDGTNDRLQVDHDSSLSFGHARSFSVWVNIDAWGTSGKGYSLMLLGDHAGSVTTGWRVGSQASSALKQRVGHSVNNGTYSIDVESTSNMSLSTWTKIDVTSDGSHTRFYLNGSLDRTVSNTVLPPTSTNPFYIGGQASSANSYRAFDGRLDEMRVVKGVTHSGDWIATEYANQNAPGAFVTVGSEESN